VGKPVIWVCVVLVDDLGEQRERHLIIACFKSPFGIVKIAAGIIRTDITLTSGARLCWISNREVVNYGRLPATE
jgi:hypothetical protein